MNSSQSVLLRRNPPERRARPVGSRQRPPLPLYGAPGAPRGMKVRGPWARERREPLRLSPEVQTFGDAVTIESDEASSGHHPGDPAGTSQASDIVESTASTWSHHRSSPARSCTSTAARHRPPTSRPSTGHDTRGCRSTRRGQGGDLRRADRLPRLGTPPCPRTGAAGRWAPPAPSGHLLSPAPRPSLLNKLQVQLFDLERLAVAQSRPRSTYAETLPPAPVTSFECARVPSRDARRSGRSNPSPGHRGCGGALATTTRRRPVDSVKHSPCGAAVGARPHAVAR